MIKQNKKSSCNQSKDRIVKAVRQSTGQRVSFGAEKEDQFVAHSVVQFECV